MKNYALVVKGVEDLLVESYENQDKTTVSKILQEMKNNTKFKFLYAMVDNLTNGVVAPEEVDAFINENIKVAKSMDFTIFNSLITENAQEESNELLDSVGVILFEKKTVLNMSDYNKAYAIVRTHLIEQNTWEEDYRTQLSEYSKKYVTMDAEDKGLFEKFMRTNPKNRKELFESMVNECVGVLNENLKDVKDSGTKLKMYETKDMISSYEYDESNYVEKMVVIHELKKNLI